MINIKRGAPGSITAQAAAVWSQTDKFTAAIILFALIYVLLRLTPSSYGYAMNLMEAGKPGLYVGKARGIRSDEWAVWTPLFQVAVNNGFQRFNLTSPYGEDLLNFNALPLWDWGLIFKPQLWSFFVLEPARAFSVYHAVIASAFVIGWRGFFEKLGFSALASSLGALIYFFSASVQGWWTTVGPALAFFPFLPWLFLTRLHFVFKTLLFVWVSAVWFISHLYPPLTISLGFVGVILIAALKPGDALKASNVLPAVLGAAIGGALTYLYLFDAFTMMAQTVYPGHRRSAGGGMPIEQWIAQLIPHFDIVGTATFLERNYLEATTAGSYLPLLALCFADRNGLAKLFTPEHKADRNALLVIIASYTLISVWQLAPVPQNWGSPLLWNFVPPHRFVFATGVLTLAAAMVVVRVAPMVLTPRRFIIAAGVILGSYVISKGLFAGGGEQFRRGQADLIPLVFLAILFFTRRKLSGKETKGVLAAALASGLVAFGFYNPVQSAWPIFHRPKSPIEDKLNALQAIHPQHWLVYDGIDGAVLNGWGFRSLSHVLTQPQLGFFRKQFPAIPPGEFNFIFNRYAHIDLREIDKPFTPQADVIALPYKMFAPAANPQDPGK